MLLHRFLYFPLRGISAERNVFFYSATFREYTGSGNWMRRLRTPDYMGGIMYCCDVGRCRLSHWPFDVQFSVAMSDCSVLSWVNIYVYLQWRLSLYGAR